ncbi:MAG: outer membrane lipoprotein carrier protein LolA [Flavobacteriales bacterium]
MKIFKLISLTCVLMSCSMLFAQTRDPKAKAILDAMSKKTKSYASLKVDFAYILRNKAEGLNEKQNGTLYLKGDKYRLEMAGQHVMCDGKTVWTFIVDADEVQVDNVPDPGENEDQLLDPTRIFSLYEKNFKYKFKKEETRNGKVVQIIDLYPEKAADKSYHTVQLVIDKQKKQMISMEVMGKDGNHYIYKLKTITPNASAPDTLFKFDVSKAGDVIDLRE